MIDVEKEIQKHYPNLQKTPLLNRSITQFISSLAHQKQINDFLQSRAHLSCFDFIDSVLEYFEFDYKISATSLENIPTSGRAVVVANHPLGGLDALVLLKLLGKVRKDIKIVANSFLQRFEALHPLMLEVDNFQKRQSKRSINNIYEALNKDMLVVIFPSGEVSRLGPGGVKDGKWHKGFLNFAKTTSSPILPIFLGGKNSKRFYSISTIHKSLATLLLADEMFKQKGKKIEVVVGEIIPYEHIMPTGLQLDKVCKLYKKHLYGLVKGSGYFQTQKAIAHPESVQDIKKELESAQLLGKTRDQKSIYLYSPQKDDALLKELGRLREISFRKVGEGVNKKRDIDMYDLYYEHIVLYDVDALEVVGAYRIAPCAKIVQDRGVEGLYTASLFDFTKEFQQHYLPNAIELGRSFVQPKYWGTKALDYLWQGIGAYLATHKQIRYLFGPVTISASYPKIAKDAILHFYDHYFGAKKSLAAAKITYDFEREKSLDMFTQELDYDDYKSDFKKLRKFLMQLEVTVPMLYKQYSEICEKEGVQFCCYSVDPEFSNCIDSFIVVDLEKLKDSQRKRYIQN